MGRLVPDVPGLILTATIWMYYGVSIPLLVARVRRRSGNPVGLLPELRLERAMWVLWTPLMAAWIVLPYLALTRRHPLLAVPAVALADPVASAVRWVAAGCAVLCFLMILECIVRMGKNWRIGVVPSQSTDLVTGGLYARVRHPIYALNIFLMICSAVVVPTIPMMAIGALHIGLILIKARNEERFLLEAHGQRYADYCRRTGRFFPRLISRDG
jgi:protein-S-isoprenylcysteine O-methyltransferase Ste14